MTNHWKDAQQQRDYVNALMDAHEYAVRPPAPAPVRPHSLLAWGIVLCCLAIVGIAVWFLTGVQVDW